MNEHLLKELKVQPTKITISMVESNMAALAKAEIKNPKASDAELLSSVPSLRGLFTLNDVASAKILPEQFAVDGEIQFKNTKPSAVYLPEPRKLECAFGVITRA